MRAVECKARCVRGEVSTRVNQDYGEKRWHVHCPVCGSKLARSKQSDSDIECHKCHSSIGILVKDGMVAVVDKTTTENGEGHRSMAATYMQKLSRMVDGV